MDIHTKKQEEDGRIDPQGYTNICVYIGKSEQLEGMGVQAGGILLIVILRAKLAIFPR